MKKIILGVFGLFLMGVFSQNPAFAEDTVTPEMVYKLNSISEKQDKILAELENIKTELKIVKIRTTLNG